MAQDPYKYFRIEARELVEGLGRHLLALERGGAAEGVAPLLRLAHTLKGAARVVRQAVLAEAAHRFEELCMPYRDGGAVPPRERVDELLKVVDAMTRALQDLDAPPAPAAAPEPAPAPAPAAPAAPEAPLRTIRVEVEEMDALLEGMGEAAVALEGLDAAVDRLGEAGILLRGLGEMLEGLPEGGRMRTVQRRLRDSLEELQRTLRSGSERAARELDLALEAVQRMRLVPAGTVFPALERAARDAGRALGRELRFESAGGEHRLDAHVLAGLQEALQHLVRNAVAHGIEDPAARAAAGKDPVGAVRVEVSRKGHRLAFLCRDDGRGFDLAGIRREARVRGRLAPAEAEALDLEGALRLLLRGGLSTTGRADEISGRGIGLEAVGSVAARLKGEVRAGAGAAGGSWVELCVPISLATVPALQVEASGGVASLPMEAVRGALRVPAGGLLRAGEAWRVAFEEGTVPFAPLSALLGGASSLPPEGTACSAVVVEAGARRVAVGVDRVLGTADVVMKPLPALAGPVPCVAGASFDAEGHPRLLLDPAGLVSALLDRAGSLREPPPRRRDRVLVVDDSLTTRMLEQSILEAAGFEVATAVCGEEGLVRAREGDFGLILVDVEMPGMDGFTFVRTASEDPALKDIPCILVTSLDSPEDKQRGAAAGARGYIVKSEFDEAGFLGRIRQLLRRP